MRLRVQAHQTRHQEGGISDTSRQYPALRERVLVPDRGAASPASSVPPSLPEGDAWRSTKCRVAMQHQNIKVIGRNEVGDDRPLHFASQASVGWPHRAYGTGSGATEVSHLLDSSAKAAWASTVHVRTLAEQDAHAGRHYNGLQEVDRARAGPRGLVQARDPTSILIALYGTRAAGAALHVPTPLLSSPLLSSL